MGDNAQSASIQTRIQSSNEKALTSLIKQLRSPLGVIPFLGAGVSKSLKYRQWGEVLTTIADERLGEKDRAPIKDALANERYLLAADLLAKAIGEQYFKLAIAEEFSEDRLQKADLTRGLLSYLPLLAAGPVITTNFDRVIEHVFARAERRFKTTVLGANPDQIIPAIQQNELVLWKIHGDYADSRTRVFQEREYNRHYRQLPKLLLIALLNRPALFICCSLEQDRTTDVLRSVHAKHPGAMHFAIVPAPPKEEEFDQRVKALQAMGVRSIWYPKGKHGEIANYLSDLVYALSSQPLPEANLNEAPDDPPRLTTEQASGVLTAEIDKLRIQVDHALPDVRDYPAEVPPFAPILAKMQRGQVAFFLGAGALMGKLPLGWQFYIDLIAQFHSDESGLNDPNVFANMQLPRITQYLDDQYGRDVLYTEVAKQLESTKAEPTVIHWFIATLQNRLRAKGFKPAQLWIITTNYDDWMEHALRSLGQRFHLFTYRVSDPYAGSFVYQSPDGSVRIVDRPSHFRRLPEDDPVLVKLHGGLHRTIDLPTSYAFTHRDFVELGGKLRQVIPQIVLDCLGQRSLLFLGSGLGDDSIESVVREKHRVDPNNRSWAIQWTNRPDMRLYWEQLGLHTILIPQQRFILELHNKIEALGSIKPPS